METAALTLNGEGGDCKGVGGECASGWVAGWVWVSSFVACTSLPRHREREWAEAAVT